MSSLVLELQQEAINPKIKVSDVLRKALLVATKLNITEFRDWIEKELKGYKDDKIPEYRHLKGEIKAWNPYNGWIPFMFEDPEIAELLSCRAANASLPELEHLLEGDTKGTIHMPFSQAVLNDLNSEAMRLGLVPTLVIGRSRVFGVVEAVRNIVVEWSLKLEKEGILGDGLTFSKEEKQKAAAVTYNIQNFTGVAGNVQAENLQIGDYNSIHAALKRLGVSQQERNDLENILDELKGATDHQRKSILRRGTDWILRNAKEIGALSDTIRGWFEKIS